MGNEMTATPETKFPLTKAEIKRVQKFLGKASGVPYPITDDDFERFRKNGILKEEKTKNGILWERWEDSGISLWVGRKIV